MGDAAVANAPPPIDDSPDVTVQASSYSLRVSNANGYLCRITCDAAYPGVPPTTIYRVLSSEWDGCGSTSETEREGFPRLQT